MSLEPVCGATSKAVLLKVLEQHELNGWMEREHRYVTLAVDTICPCCATGQSIANTQHIINLKYEWKNY